MPRRRRHSALLPDPAAVHPADPNRVGWRTVVACGKEHLDILIRQALADRATADASHDAAARAENVPGEEERD